MTLRTELVALDKAHIWPPYTPSDRHQAANPLVVASAEESWLVDINGERYLDASGAWWCNNLGFCHPRLVTRIREQAQHLLHCGLTGATHEPAARLAAELVEIAPDGLTRVFYSDNGSTSVEVALKMAFQFWHQNGRPQRTRFLSLPGAYHGDTIGAMSVSGIGEFVESYEALLFKRSKDPAPRDANGWREAFSRLCERLRKERDEIAAVIVEPIVLGVAGMRMYPPELLAELRNVCTEVDTFLIADEVFTGFGRTGRMWACDHAAVAPDILCTAKGLTGGNLPA